jgi:4-alpha-glucanotransferase
VAFHAWLQWVLDAQLEGAARDVELIQDLPIGLDAAGADAWCWQELLAHDVSVGAPPDELNPAGQDWGLTPFVPHRMRAAGYQPFIETIRATARHAGGLRIDHVMGLFRLFWIPRGAGPSGGAFVRPRVDELLAIVALESERAGAFVVGEDLGTVEDGVRETLADWGLLSYRLAVFEPKPPSEYPELALTSVSTHDLPTIAGLWTKADLARSRAAGVAQNEQGLGELRARLATAAGVGDDRPIEEVIEKVHAALSRAPSRILLASLDDALAVEERPNLPGASSDFPNWSLALPVGLEELIQRELPGRIARALSRTV